MKKRERSLLYGKLARKLHKKLDCKYFYYKIPDTFGIGGKRPFDSILIAHGVPVAIEIKSKGDKLLPYQKACLDMVSESGGVSMVFTDGECMDAFINILKENVNMKLIYREPLFSC